MVRLANREELLMKTKDAVRRCRKASGENTEVFAARFPTVTKKMVENWEVGHSLPPPHVRVYLVKEGYLDEDLDVRLLPTEEKIGELAVRLKEYEETREKLNALAREAEERWKRVTELVFE